MTDRTLVGPLDLDGLSFDPQGLLPVVAQDASTGRVLMVAWANRKALEETLATGEMHFWSRSRGELWRKGATSGSTQAVRSLHADCDGDTVLALVEPAGPACHTGETTCFGDDTSIHSLDRLWDTLQARAADRPTGSYTARLLADENLRVKKLGEENGELIHALARGDADAVREEAADLVYHLLVALLPAGVSLQQVLDELDARRNRSRRDG